MPSSFLSWKIALDGLKCEAAMRTIEDPTPSPAARELASRARCMPQEVWMDRVRAAARTGVDPGIELPPNCVTYGWSVSMSRYRLPDGCYVWHLSAKLHPTGRSSTERDWVMLGKIAKHLGAPPEPLIVPEDPSEAHHWMWGEAS